MSSEGSSDVFVALPTYDGKIHIGAFYGILKASKKTFWPHHIGSSLLPLTFNRLWAGGVASGKSYFAMIHADVCPGKLWLDVLQEEMEKHQADIVSAVIAIKTDHGDTSTAMDTGAKPRLLSIEECSRLPETFDASDVQKTLGIKGSLLVNTGLFIIDLRKEWVRKVRFRIESKIEWDKADPDTGLPLVVTEPEDWFMSRTLNDLGCKVMATRKIPVAHVGSAMYGNQIS